ncbi:glycerophosphodiester phosphodiesterase [Parafilimonas sp.]|uniref:glycerophosphodiester phosphodiesterase n=1 Tax=Parafilimonas sp. TaxID=1969739 RepID=UPI0039E711D2
MKKIFVLSAIALLAAACSVSRNSNAKIKFAANVVVAHRGAHALSNLPENSIASLQQAIQLHCTGSEFDVWMTADDSLVIHHDSDYNKLTIETTGFSELRKYPFPNGEPLPSLREYLLAGVKDNHATRLVLEIKPSKISKERSIAVTDKVIQLVHELGCAKFMVYISFDYDIMKHIHAIEPGAITQYLNGDIAPAALKADGISGADYHFSVFAKNPAWITEAKKNNIRLNAWTVDDTTNMRWLLDSGFNFITTNQPEMLFELLKSRK